MQPLFRRLKNELNEDELLHFVVVRMSFPLNGYFLDALKCFSIILKDCLNLNNLSILQNGQYLLGSFTIYLVRLDLK